MELQLPAIKGIGGAPIYLIDRYGDRALSSTTSISAIFDRVDRHPVGAGLTRSIT